MNLMLLAADEGRLQQLRASLGAQADLPLVARAGGVEELVRLANGSVPDILVVDAPDEAQIEAIGALGRQRPSLQAIAVSADHTPQFLMRAMRAGVREVVLPAELVPGLGEALARARSQCAEEPAAKQPGRILAFVACKGGGGATFLAANLAYTLAAELHQRVALIDLNLQFGDAALYVSDRHAPSNVAELCQQIHRLDGALLESSMLDVLPDFHILAAPDDPAHIPDVRREHIEAILELARQRYDIVIVDAGRTLDAATLRALDLADAIYCVLQMNLPFVRAARRLLDVWRSLDYPAQKIHLLVNRNGRSSELALADVEKALGRSVEVTVPNSYSAVASSINLGIPLLKTQRGNPVARALFDLARQVAPNGEPAGAASGWISRVFGGH